MRDWRGRSRECLWIMKLFKQQASVCFCVTMLACVTCIISPHQCLLFPVWLYCLSLFSQGVNVESAMLHEFAAVGGGPERGVLLFPEICSMELQLLATGSPDLEVLSHVFHSLLSAVHANRCNAALLYNQVRGITSSILSCSFPPQQTICLTVLSAVRIMTNLLFWFLQGGVKTILSGFHNILSQTDPSFTGLLFLLP